MNFNNYKNSSVPKKIISVIIIFLLITFIIVYFFIISTIKNIKSLKNNIITQKIEMENKIANEKNLESLNEKIKKIEPQLEKFNQIFINQNRYLEFITTVEGIAEKNHISQKITFDPNSGTAGQGYKKVLINLELSGDYINFLKYLNSLETLPYYINIFQIDISAGNSNINQINSNNLKSKKDIKISMSADTYWK